MENASYTKLTDRDGPGNQHFCPVPAYRHLLLLNVKSIDENGLKWFSTKPRLGELS